ncbi:hypothetical protein Y1Q_0019364 [Alligator mississippiensis]|uniref:Uncharacterized protein n=1 Tax=Alligator mississippiensis TaxID=8496 RepID=A0A151MQY5_ALLMI|nr:hypothetical protein Y1Q_0019364 [Alligator mississippiensis]
MDKVLNLHQRCTPVCIDNIIIFLPSWQQHLQDIQAVFQDNRGSETQVSEFWEPRTHKACNSPCAVLRGAGRLRERELQPHTTTRSTERRSTSRRPHLLHRLVCGGGGNKSRGRVTLLSPPRHQHLTQAAHWKMEMDVKGVSPCPEPIPHAQGAGGCQQQQQQRQQDEQPGESASASSASDHPGKRPNSEREDKKHFECLGVTRYSGSLILKCQGDCVEIFWISLNMICGVENNEISS